jgi:hypothetical protein
MEFLVNTLNRVSFMDDEQLKFVLNDILPVVLAQLNTATTDEERKKCIELLSHLSKRIRPNKSIPLPCTDLLRIATAANTTSFCRNFTSAFLEMGAQRLVSREEKAMLACLSLSNLTDCRKLNNSNNNDNDNNNRPFFLPVELMQCSVVLHLMEDLNHVSEKSFLDTGFTSHRPPHGGHNSWFDVTRIVDFLIDIMLTPVLRPDNIEQICNKGKSTLSEGSTTTSSTSGGGGGGAVGGGVFLVPPGLSPQRLHRLVGKRIGDDDVAFVDSWTTAVKFSHTHAAFPQWAFFFFFFFQIFTHPCTYTHIYIYIYI